MKKVGQIFSVLGGVFSIFSGLFFILFAILCFCLAIPDVKQLILEGLASWEDSSSYPIAEYVDILIAGASGFGIGFLISSVFYFVAGGLSFGCQKKGRYIGAIVFSILTGVQFFILLGAIFGMIADKKARNTQPAQ